MRYSLVIWIWLLVVPAYSQFEFTPNFGAQLGVSFSLGTHANRMGFMAKFFYQYEYIQANLQLSGFYNFQALGNKEKGFEGQVKLGVVGAWGPKDTIANPFLNEVSNQTGRKYAVGYSYNYYFDNMGTSQFTGTFGFEAWNARLLFENDYMAFMSQDKFRSGAIGLFYRLNNTQFGLSHIAWTGDPYHEGGKVVEDDEQFPAKYGYMDMSEAPYGGFSSGILAVSIEHKIPYEQYLGASIGIDADQIRNVLQNKAIHENKVLKNPHIPMVDAEGEQYLYRDDQKIRPAKFYLQFMGNGALFY
ncbi:MAG: hypothetical protein GY810_17850 [Aureispira sp.]|nr:hypothetical protein [Aureispira sp.]